MSDLIKDSKNVAIQAMPLVENKIGLTTGTGLTGRLILCTVDGGFTITFASTGTKAITMIEGQVRSLPEGSSVAITSGTFDMA